MVVRAVIKLLVLAILIGIAREHIDWQQVVVPYRLARLYTQPADKVLFMPVRGVAATAVANTWHAPRSGGRKHEGEDIFAPRGTPVLAATDGVVVRFGGGKLGGNAVWVAGRGGRLYYYAHLDHYRPHLRTGDLVDGGDVLGYVGNTGNATTTPSHLHLGIYGAQGAVDPLQFAFRNEPTIPNQSSHRKTQKT